MSMHSTVEKMAWDIVEAEGGLVDDKDDAGGITNVGVSLRYARGIGLDLDGDGDTDADDIRLVTPAKAVQLFMSDFFYGPRIDRLPRLLHAQVFDLGVNAGPPRAIMVAQKVANILVDVFPGTDLKYKVTVDGVVGPQTRRALEEVVRLHGEKKVNNLYVRKRVAFYRGITLRRPSQLKFLKGWTRRARKFLIK